MKAILVPGLGPPPRADGAEATKRSHLNDSCGCTGRGSRGRLRSERRLVLGFFWSLNCGGFAWAPYKGSTRPKGHISCASSRPSTADQKVSLQSPQTPSQTRCGRPAPSRGRARRANAKKRLLKHQKHDACGAPAQSGPPASGRRAPAPLRRWRNAEKASTQKAERPEPSPRRVTRTATSSFKISPARRR